MLDTLTEGTSTYGPWLFLGVFALSVFAWEIWQHRIRPMRVPKSEIARMADQQIAKYGSRAEEMAFMEEDRAWRYSDSYKQGLWLRVRKELQRRHRVGEWSDGADT